MYTRGQQIYVYILNITAHVLYDQTFFYSYITLWSLGNCKYIESSVKNDDFDNIEALANIKKAALTISCDPGASKRRYMVVSTESYQFSYLIQKTTIGGNC